MDTILTITGVITGATIAYYLFRPIKSITQTGAGFAEQFSTMAEVTLAESNAEFLDEIKANKEAGVKYTSTKKLQAELKGIIDS
jgi:hypothetical protein